MLEVQNVTKFYGRKKALDDIAFSLEKGNVVGFVGPNGAGKSTTMNIITGYLGASSGNTRICGIDFRADPLAYKKNLGYLPEIPPLYSDMTVNEYLSFVCDIKDIKTNRRDTIDQVTRMTHIEDVRNRLINNLSKGYKQRVGMAQAIIGDPPVIVLDEPTIGLDPGQIIEVRALLGALKNDHAILFSSHILSEIMEVCDRIILINEGKLIADDTPKRLAGMLDGEKSSCLLRSAGEPDRIVRCVMAVDGVLDCRETTGKESGKRDYIAEYPRGVEVRDKVAAALAAEGLPLFAIEDKTTSLEDVFLFLTSEEAGKAEGARV